jgi:hypothetical protein
MPGPTVRVTRVPCDVRVNKGKEEEMESVPMTERAAEADVAFAMDTEVEDTRSAHDNYGVVNVDESKPSTSMQNVLQFQSPTLSSSSQQASAPACCESKPVTYTVTEYDLTKLAALSSFLGFGLGVLSYKFVLKPPVPAAETCALCLEALP